MSIDRIEVDSVEYKLNWAGGYSYGSMPDDLLLFLKAHNPYAEDALKSAEAGLVTNDPGGYWTTQDGMNEEESRRWWCEYKVNKRKDAITKAKDAWQKAGAPKFNVKVGSMHTLEDIMAVFPPEFCFTD